jgi:small nuclear ribonucleoprotein (snRNP)-like protein
MFFRKIENFLSFKFLKKLVGKTIFICFNLNQEIKGKLFAFDKFFNLILKKKVFCRNYSIFKKKEKKEKKIFIRGEKIVYLKFKEKFFKI